MFISSWNSYDFQGLKPQPRFISFWNSYDFQGFTFLIKPPVGSHKNLLFQGSKPEAGRSTKLSASFKERRAIFVTSVAQKKNAEIGRSQIEKSKKKKVFQKAVNFSIEIYYINTVNMKLKGV